MRYLPAALLLVISSVVVRAADTDWTKPADLNGISRSINELKVAAAAAAAPDQAPAVASLTQETVPSPSDVAALQAKAEQGDAKAQIELSELYFNGKGVEKDLAAGAKWLRMAADQGNAYAQTSLGVYYRDGGNGFPQDYKIAALWFRKGADQGNSQAIFSLAELYQNGRGVDQNYRLAAEWYRKDAEHGRSGSANNLGLLYYYGRGVAQDYAEAYFWFTVAKSSNADRAAAKLLPEELAAVQKRVKDWKPVSTKP